MPFIKVKKLSLGWKRGRKKREERGNKLKVRSNDLFSMECIGVSSPTLVFFLRFRHQVPFIRVKKPSLGWKRGGKKGGGEGR